MNVVDSSGWLEYFADGSNTDFFAPAITDESNLVVPTICMYEVFKRLSVQRGKEAALQTTGMLYRGQLAALSDEIALQATLWTQDEHFKGIPDVEYIEKK
jgi:hypothetical protein